MTRLASRTPPVLALVLLSFAAGCTRQAVGGGRAAAASVAPQLSVERFLQAANDRDIGAMARLFGTADGPVGDTGSTFGCAFKKIGSWFGGQACTKRAQVEVRMDAMAIILRHDDYSIVGEEPVAGRDHPSTRVLVNLVVDDRTITNVPFVVVQASGGRWLIQEVDLERVIGR